MRIVVATSAFPILSETFVLNQITGLIDRGHDVHVLATRLGDVDIVHPDVERYGLMERISLFGDGYTLMPKAKLSRAMGALRLLADGYRHSSLRQLALATNVVRHGKDALTLNLLYRSAHLNAVIREADVVLCHFGQVGEMTARLKDIGMIRSPIATAFHGHDLSRDLLHAGRRPYRFLFEHGDLFMPVSEHYRQTLEAYGCAPERIVVHRMGIDTSALAQVAARRRTDRSCRPIVLSVARFVEKKGLADGIAAFATVAETFPGARYHLIGNGPLRDALASRIEELGLGERVKLLPPRDAEGIRDALADADVFMLPSVTAADGDKEGVPVVLMEAMAASLPVVSTVHSGIPELVDDGETGFLVPEGDTEALAERLMQLLESPARASVMGRAGQRKVRHEFDIEELNNVLELRLKALVERTDSDR